MGKKKKKKIAPNKIIEKKVDVEEAKTVDAVDIKPAAAVGEAVTKSKAKKPKKEKKENRLVRRLKETGSELKKVTWPTFPKVVKQTGIVLAVVLFFGILLFGFDYLLKFLFELLVG